MADSPISSLQAVQDLQNGQPDIGMTDLFVLEQNNTAKKLTGEQITKFVDRNVVSYEGEIVASDAAGGARYRNETLTLVLPHGPGIKQVVAPSNPGQPGATDTYTLIGEDVCTSNGLTPGGTLGTFSVYNGRNGEGLVNSVMGVSPPSGSTDIVKATLMNLIYPLYSIYMTEDATFDPNTAFGGTWVQIKDCFLLAAGDTYSTGTTDGAATHTLSEAELPAHTHGLSALGGVGLMSWPIPEADEGHAPTDWGQSKSPRVTMVSETESTGSGTAFSIMPPYRVVCVWKRTALAT